MTDPREEKLPRWARDELAKARRAARDAERKLADHVAAAERSRIWYGSYDNPIYVPETNGYQRLHFTLGERDTYDEIQVSIKDGGLEVMGGHGIVLEPQVSNVVHVRLS